MSKTQKFIVIGLAIIVGVCLVAYLSLYILAKIVFPDSESGSDYVDYSNPDHVAFGDGGSVWIPIDRDASLLVGSQANLHDLLITVENSGPIADTSNMDHQAEGWIYWQLDIRLENNSVTETIRVRPAFDSRIQGYVIDRVSPHSYIDSGFATTEYRMKNNSELAPGEVLTGTLIYEVDQDSSELFWIYEVHSEGNLDYAFFKIR